MTTVRDAEKWLNDAVGFDAKLSRAERRNAAKQLYRRKRPPKIDPKANAKYLASIEEQRERYLAAAAAETRATAELMRTSKIRPTTFSEGA